MNDDEEPKDWEIQDEEPPETLKRKWEEEARGSNTVVCSSCNKETSAGNLTCIFCGTDLYFKNEGDQCRPNYHFGKEVKSLGGTTLSQGNGPGSCLLTWIKRLFNRG